MKYTNIIRNTLEAEARALHVHHQQQVTDVIRVPAAKRKKIFFMNLTNFLGEKLTHGQVRIFCVIVFGGCKIN